MARQLQLSLSHVIASEGARIVTIFFLYLKWWISKASQRMLDHYSDNGEPYLLDELYPGDPDSAEDHVYYDCFRG